MTRLRSAGRDPGTGLPCWELQLPPLEAALVVGLPDRLEATLADPDRNARVIARLFPRSYADEGDERELRRLLGTSLLDGRRQLVARVRALLAGGCRGAAGLTVRLRADEADLFLRFVNDYRLVLATELDVQQNMGETKVDWCHPDAPRYALLEYLGMVELLFVEALAGPPPGARTRP